MHRALLVVGAMVSVIGAEAAVAHASGPNSQSAAKIQEIPLPANVNTPYTMTMGSDGNIWYVGSYGSTVSRMTPTGQLTTFSVNTTDGLVSITSGADGALYISSYEGNIYRVTTAGVETNAFNVVPRGWEGNVTSGPDGNIWFTGNNPGHCYYGNPFEPARCGNVGRMTLQGVVTMYPIAETYDAWQITAGPDGNIWFTVDVDFFQTATIGRVNVKTGAVDEFPEPQNINGHAAPSAITAGPDGNVWFSDFFDSIGKITPAGVITMYPVGQENPFPSQPEGIVAGPDGALWFTIHAFGVIGRMTTDGQWTRFPLPYVGEGPHAIVRGPHDTVWWSEDINRLAYIKLCGVGSGCAT